MTLFAKFIDNCADELDWNFISHYINIPIWLIRKHKDKLNWKIFIKNNKNLSDDFIDEFSNYIDFELLMFNKISPYIIKKYYDINNFDEKTITYFC